MNANPQVKLNNGSGAGKKPGSYDLTATHKKLKADNKAAERSFRQLKQRNIQFFDDDDDELSNDGEMDLNTGSSDDEYDEEEEDEEEESRDLESDDDESEEERAVKKRKRPESEQAQRSLKRRIQEAQPINNNIFTQSMKEPRLQQQVAAAAAVAEEKAFFLADEERLKQIVSQASRSIEELARLDESLRATEKDAMNALRALETAEKNAVRGDSDQFAKELSAREAELVKKEELHTTRAKELLLKTDEFVRIENEIAERNRQSQLEAASLSTKTAECARLELALAERNKQSQLEAASLSAKTAECARLELALAERHKQSLIEASECAERKLVLQRESGALDSNLKEYARQQQQLALAKEDLEKREKALALVKPALVVKPAPLSPLESFMAEMIKSNQNMLTKEEMIGVVPQSLLANLAYYGGKMPLKFNSVSNGQYIILEVSNISMPDTPQLVMRQIVSKNLYNAK